MAANLSPLRSYLADLGCAVFPERLSSGHIGEQGQTKGAGAACPGPFKEKSSGYESRSLRLPFFSLALPFLWSERPSLFVLLSPVREPPASFIRPLALSIAPSFLSSLLLLLGTATSSFGSL